MVFGNVVDVPELVTSQQMEDMWGVLKDTMTPHINDPEFKSKLKDIVITSDLLKKKIKPKKSNSFDNEIRIGDLLERDGVIGKVIDTDDELICVEVEINDTIEVWNRDEVRRV